MAWTVGAVVEFRLPHTVVVGSISCGGDHGVHCWWDLIRSKQLFSAPYVARRCLLDFLVWVISNKQTKYIQLIHHYSKLPHIHSLPKIHKYGIPLRPIVSNRGSACHPLCRFLVEIISPLTGKSSSYVKNSAHFVARISDYPIHSNQMVSLDVVSLFTKVTTDETFAVVWDKLAADPLLGERTCIPIDMLTFCVETTYFGMGFDIYRQEEGLAMGSPLSPVLANIFMEYFEEMALGSTSLKSSIWLRYVDDTFILWPHQEDVQTLLDHVNSIRPSIQFTLEKEQEKQITLPRCISNTHRARIQVICV